MIGKLNPLRNIELEKKRMVKHNDIVLTNTIGDIIRDLDNERKVCDLERGSICYDMDTWAKDVYPRRE